MEENEITDESQQEQQSSGKGKKSSLIGGFLKEGFKKKAAKGGKAKIIMAIMKVLIPILIKVLIPVIIVTVLIAGFFVIIKGDQKKTISGSYSAALGYGYSVEAVEGADQNTGNTINILPGTDGRYHIEYNVTEEEADYVRAFFEEKNEGVLSEENIKFIAALVKHGYKLEKYNNINQIRALLLFFKAETASQSLDLRPKSEMFKDGKYNPPSFDEEGIPGIITVKKYTVNGTDVNEEVLEYMPKESFDAITDNTNKNNFTIDEFGKLVIVNTTEVTTEYAYSDTCPEEEKMEDSPTTYTITQKPVDFKPLIAKSSLPFNLMVTLMTYIEDPDFYTNIAETVRTSNIVLALKEEETISIDTTKATYTPRTEKYYDFKYTVKYMTGAETTETLVDEDVVSEDEVWIYLNRYHYPLSYITGHYEWESDKITYREGYTQVGHKRHLKIEKVVKGTEKTVQGTEQPLKLSIEDTLKYGDNFEITTTTTTKTYKQGLEIKELKNWFMDYKIEGYLGTTNTTNPEPEDPEDLPIEDYTLITNREDYSSFDKTEPIPADDKIISKYKSDFEQEISDGLDFTWNIFEDAIFHKTTNFITKRENSRSSSITTITNGEIAQEYRDQFSEGSFLYYYDKSSIAQGVINSARGMIFESLENDTDTINQVDILKYLLYLYTGDESFNRDIDWQSMVGTLDFQTFSGAIDHIRYTVQFSWPSYNDKRYVKTVDGIEFYKVYFISGGNPTIGRGDVDLYWNGDVTNRIGTKTGRYLINGTTISSEEVNLDTYIKEQLGVTEYKKVYSTKEIWVEAEPIDEIAHEIWDANLRINKWKIREYTFFKSKSRNVCIGSYSLCKRMENS